MISRMATALIADDTINYKPQQQTHTFIYISLAAWVGFHSRFDSSIRQNLL